MSQSSSRRDDSRRDFFAQGLVVDYGRWKMHRLRRSEQADQQQGIDLQGILEAHAGFPRSAVHLAWIEHGYLARPHAPESSPAPDTDVAAKERDAVRLVEMQRTPVTGPDVGSDFAEAGNPTQIATAVHRRTVARLIPACQDLRSRTGAAVALRHGSTRG